MGTATKEAAEREADLIRREARRGRPILDAARRDADDMIGEARGQASRQSDQLRGEQRRLEEETAALDRVHRTYLAQLRLMAERQLAELSAAEERTLPPPRPPGAALESGASRGRRRAGVTGAPRRSGRRASRAIAPRRRGRARTRGARSPGSCSARGSAGLAAQLDVEVRIEYADIPGMPLSTVESHAGRLLCGTLAGVPVIAMQGRFHRYEGHALVDVAFPVRVLHALGASVLVVSNACGGMHPLWAPGDVMLIADHLNVLGDNPLAGPHDAREGARFPDMTAPYDAELRTIARRIAARDGLVLREGVYAAVLGPNLETRAEYRMLRLMGADVVGMSTVPEVTVARQLGMRVLGLSLITDQCLPDAPPAGVARADPRRGAPGPSRRSRHRRGRRGRAAGAARRRAGRPSRPELP
jgi:purine-nucleoside phosphorylase